MSAPARVTVDGVPNEPVSREEFASLVDPLCDALGVSSDDVVSLHVTPDAIRAKVVVRTRRGRRLSGSWAHLVRKVDLRTHEDDVR